MRQEPVTWLADAPDRLDRRGVTCQASSPCQDAKVYISDQRLQCRVGEYLRPIDLARVAGLSVQSIRQYEAWGFLPPAQRSPSGYRRYEERHRRALLAARAVIAGYGWQHALAVMRAVHAGKRATAFALADAAHAALHERRREIEATLSALRVAAAEGPAMPRSRRASGRRAPLIHVGAAARQAGVRVSTVRFWERQGLLQPRRDAGNAYRLYDGEQLGRLHIVVLLRRGGYGFEAIRAVLDELSGGRVDRAVVAAEQRLRDLEEASRRCAAATATLWSYAQELQAQAPQA